MEDSDCEYFVDGSSDEEGGEGDIQRFGTANSHDSPQR